MINEQQLVSAIDICYDAVLAPETWPDALHALARSLDAVCSMFYPENHSGRFQSVPASRDYGSFLEHYVREGWYENHYRADRGWPLIKRGKTVIVEHDLASDGERRRLRHYNDLYLRWGFPGFAAIGFRLDGEHWCVPLLRTASQGHFEAAEAERMAELATHFRRMVKLSGDLLRERATAGLDLLDAIRSAAILIDANHCVIAMNRRAEHLLNNGLVVRNGRLDTQDPAAKANLHRLVGEGTTAGSGAPPTAPVIIRRPDKHPLVLEAFPAKGRLGDLFCSFGVLIVATDLDERCGPDANTVREIFGLTPAEARLAAELVLSSDLEAAATRIGITKGTARNQLKSIFNKTEFNRQSDLIAALTRVPVFKRAVTDSGT